MSKALLTEIGSNNAFVLDGKALIGSGHDDDIVLTGEGIIPHHVALISIGDRWYVSDLRSGDTIGIDNCLTTPDGKLELQDNCTLTLGKVQLRFTTDQAQVAQALKARDAQTKLREQKTVSPAEAAPEKTGFKTPRKSRNIAIAAGACLLLLVIALVAINGSKSGDVRRLEKEIDQIGEVSPASEAQIDQLMDDFNQLSDSERAQVENADALAEAEAQLRAMQEAGQFDRGVEALGAVSLDSAEDISALRARYDAMDDLARSYVTAEGKLSQAEAELQNMAAAELDRQILALGDVTLDSKESLDALRAAYDQADPAVQKLVSNLSVLEEAEAAWQELKENGDYDEVQQLYKAREWENAISASLAYLEEYEFSDRRTDVETMVIDAHINYSKDLERQKKFEEAVKLLQSAKELALASDNGKTQNAIDALQSTLNRMRPSTGSVLKGYGCTGGYCKFIVNNGNTDIVIKLQNRDDPDNKTVYFYVRANETATINMKNGEYTFKIAAGDVWYGLDEFFGEDTTYYKVNAILDFAISYSGNYVTYHILTVSIDKAIAASTVIDKSSF